MTTSTWKAVALLVLAAAVGGAAGSVLTARAACGKGGADCHRHGNAWYVALLDRELKLSAAQRDSVRAILRRRDASMDSIWTEMRPRIDAARNSIRTDISQVLTPEQQGRYRDLTARLDAERAERMRRDKAATQKDTTHE
jgi:Spy/CpxP family protein refolding chaperone